MQVQLELEVDGSTTLADLDSAIREPEEQYFICTSFGLMEFTDAIGQATAEIHVSTDEAQEPTLKKVRLIAPHGIALTVDEDKVEFTDLSFDLADAREETSDLLADYYRP